MALEMTRAKVPANFNPSSKKHVEAIIEWVSAEKGDGWEVQSYNPAEQLLTLSRGTAITEVAARGVKDSSFRVSLGDEVKASEGERTAQRLEADNPGYFLTEFKPHLRQAQLSRLTEQEVRCRDAVSGVIGVPRWEVQVTTRADGGFALRLPPKYAPSKHDNALQEVAEAVVGRPGWYIQMNPQQLIGHIIPAEEPTFEPSYPFDFKALPRRIDYESPDLWKIPLGPGLGGNGKPNTPIEADFTDSVGMLTVGLAGSGKSTAIQATVFSALCRGWRLALINTKDKQTDFMWAKKFVADGMWGCDSVAQAVTVAKLVVEEGERLGDLLSEYKASKWQDLPLEVKRQHPPLLLVADELAALLNADPPPKGLSTEMKQLPEFVQMEQDVLESKLLVTALSKIPAVYRAAGIRCMYLTQQPNERYGFTTKLKGNLPHRMILGTSPSSAEKGHAFRTPEKVPDVPLNIAQDPDRGRGVGLVHLDGQEPTVFKGYFAPLAEYVAEAERRNLPTTTRPAPSQADINRLVPRVDGEGHEDAVAPSGPNVGYGHGPRQYQPWELGPDGVPLTGYELANATRAEATRAARVAEGMANAPA